MQKSPKSRPLQKGPHKLHPETKRKRAKMDNEEPKKAKVKATERANTAHEHTVAVGRVGQRPSAG